MASRRPSISIPFSVSDFETKLRELTIIPRTTEEDWQGQPFIRGSTLTTWLESTPTPNDQVSHAALLLERAFPGQYLPPISDEDILRGDKKCPLMFCMLLELGHGDLVHKFHNCGIHDACLPMTLVNLRSNIECALPRLSKAEIDRLTQAFHDKQWEFFPLLFVQGMRPLPLDQQRRLPICQRSKINSKGGTAKLHMIAIPEEFVDDELRRAVPYSAFDHSEYGRCYQFALKSFIHLRQNLFEAEIFAYRHLQNQKHVIKCFGGFSHYGVGDDSRTYSILLEYGECDLAEYFGLVDPPALPEDVEIFWSKIFDVVKAVQGIHSYKARRGGKEEFYDGWHGDIKPDNVLMVEGQLKLADPGFVNFVRSSDRQAENGTPRVLNGWTSTYGPPEVNEAKFAVSEPWTVDIWSLGCVLSEAATWVVLSDSGRVSYTTVRQEAIKALRSGQTQPGSATSDLGDGDFFHDGRNVLPVVKQWHDVLRTMIRPNDNITKHILDLIDNQLLVQQPTKRMETRKLLSSFAQIQESAKRNCLKDSTPARVKDLIRQARNQALEQWVSSSQILEGLSVEDRKACNPATSAIITYIARNPEAMMRSRPNAAVRTQLRQSSGSNVFGHTAGEVDGHHYASEHHNISSQNGGSFRKLPHRTSTGFVSSEHVPKTVFDAYYERMAEKAKRFDKITRASTKTKDKLLSSYYLNRDITFLVDNGGNMAQVWSEVQFTLTELVGRARNQDDDGVDLIFTRSSKTVQNARRDALEKFVAAMKSNEVQPEPGVTTNMAESLGTMLFAWLEAFKQNPRSTKKMTIIVLTDGRWYSSSEEDEYLVDRKIIQFSQDVKQLHGFAYHNRPVSIQFVSFGQDRLALARLERLDDGLRYYGIEDIVDTEPSTGNINKMLLGSFNPEFDEQNTSQSPSIASPPPSQHSLQNLMFDPHRSSESNTSSQHSQSSPRGTDSNVQSPRGTNTSIQDSHSPSTHRPLSQRTPRLQLPEDRSGYSRPF